MAGPENTGMTVYLPRTKRPEQRQQATGMIIVAMRNDNFLHFRQIFIHATSIMKQCQTLSSIKQERCTPGRLYQGRKTVFTQGSGQASDRVFTENCYAKAHLQHLFWGNRGTPILVRILNSGQNCVKPD
jgi:phage terminase large subunit GpA-like protein